MLEVVLSLAASLSMFVAGFYTRVGRILTAVLWAQAMRFFGVSDSEIQTFMLNAGTNAFKPRDRS